MPALARRGTAAAFAAVLLAPLSAVAQRDVFEDPQGDSACGTINVASLEFAVRSCDGALVLITGQDAGFANTFVTEDGDVQIDGQPAGFVAFEEDGDGFFTLWWLSEDSFLIDFDDVTYEPFETDLLPADFVDAPCAASELWEGEGDCGGELGSEVMGPPALLAWNVFEDLEVESASGVINAGGLQFAVRSCDGALVLVTGDDAGFANTFVTEDGDVQIDGEAAGFVAFEEDGDGFYTLWWLSDDGFLIDFDDQAYEPFETDLLPADFADVPFAATRLWEGEGDCGGELGSETMLPVQFAAHDARPLCGVPGLATLMCTLGGLAWMSRQRRCRQGV